MASDRIRRARKARFAAAGCVASALLVANVATAESAPPAPAVEPSPDARTSAAAAFDEGVTRFERSDYVAAARAFLRADELAPSADALRNAIAAARKAGEHLLVVHAAERALAREPDPELGTQAREALAQAAKSLARLELRCEPLPCALLLDGVRVEPSTRYVLPGTHTAVAAAEDGNRVDEDLNLAVGATYTVTLHAAKRGETERAATISSGKRPESPEARGPDGEQPPPGDARASGKPLSPTLFYVGVGVTVALAGVNTWSGLDTFAAKDRLPEEPTRAEVEAVEAKILRSNLLFGSTVLVGGATIAAGLFWVDWGADAPVAATLAPLPGGALASAAGRF